MKTAVQIVRSMKLYEERYSNNGGGREASAFRQRRISRLVMTLDIFFGKREERNRIRDGSIYRTGNT